MTGTGIDVKLRGTIELDDEFVSNILITAFDGSVGGCWYWAAPAHDDWLTVLRKGDPHPDGGTCIDDLWTKVVVIDKEEPDGPQHVVSAETIAESFNKQIEMGDEWARDAFGWLIDQDEADIDANDADTIVQIAIFGSVVYG